MVDVQPGRRRDVGDAGRGMPAAHLVTDDESLVVRILLAIRNKHGWTQQQLAQALMVSRRTIVRWESGTKEPPPYVMAALRELLA